MFFPVWLRQWNETEWLLDAVIEHWDPTMHDMTQKMWLYMSFAACFCILNQAVKPLKNIWNQEAVQTLAWISSNRVGLTLANRGRSLGKKRCKSTESESHLKAGLQPWLSWLLVPSLSASRYHPNNPTRKCVLGNVTSQTQFIMPVDLGGSTSSTYSTSLQLWSLALASLYAATPLGPARQDLKTNLRFPQISDFRRVSSASNPGAEHLNLATWSLLSGGALGWLVLDTKTCQQKKK